MVMCTAKHLPGDVFAVNRIASPGVEISVSSIVNSQILTDVTFFDGKLHNAGTNTIQIVKSFDTSHKHAIVRICRECSGFQRSYRLLLITTFVIS